MTDLRRRNPSDDKEEEEELLLMPSLMLQQADSESPPSQFVDVVGAFGMLLLLPPSTLQSQAPLLQLVSSWHSFWGISMRQTTNCWLVEQIVAKSSSNTPSARRVSWTMKRKMFLVGWSVFLPLLMPYFVEFHYLSVLLMRPWWCYNCASLKRLPLFVFSSSLCA